MTDRKTNQPDYDMPSEGPGAIVSTLLLLALGSALCAVAVNGILLPHQFVGGGFTGAALMIHYLVPSASVAALYAAVNVPVFALGWIYVGRRFFLYSLAGTVLFTAMVELIDVTIPVADMLLASLLAGIITGVGSGLILRSMGSAGGLDILSVIFLKRFGLRLGTTVLFFNSAILMAAAVLFSVAMAIYTLIFIFVTGKVVDVVVTGLSQRKAVTIISSRWEEISHMVLHEMNRGLTVIDGRGGFSGDAEKIVYTVVTFREVPRLKRAVRAIDEDAFLVVADTLEVVGKRIGNQPHW